MSSLLPQPIVSNVYQYYKLHNLISRNTSDFFHPVSSWTWSHAPAKYFFHANHFPRTNMTGSPLSCCTAYYQQIYVPIYPVILKILWLLLKWITISLGICKYQAFCMFHSSETCRLGGLVVERSLLVCKGVRTPVGSRQRLKNCHLLPPWLSFTVLGLEQCWLAQYQFNVTGWGIMFICGMVLRR